MKTTKLILSIISMILFVIIALQSCAAGFSNTLQENGELGGTAGLMLGICMVIAAIVGMVTRKGGKGGAFHSRRLLSGRGSHRLCQCRELRRFKNLVYRLTGIRYCLYRRHTDCGEEKWIVIPKNLEKAMKALQTDEQIEDYLCCQQEDGEIKYFYQYLHQIADAKKIPMSQVVARSKVNRNYVYNITGGVKRNPGRDKIIALCIGACMNYEETNKALEIGGYCRLNQKTKET